MKLALYLTLEGMSVDDFADKIQRSRHGVRKWVYGQRMPRQKDLQKIAEVTSGRVMPNDFIEGAPDLQPAGAVA